MEIYPILTELSGPSKRMYEIIRVPNELISSMLQALFWKVDIYSTGKQILWIYKTNILQCVNDALLMDLNPCPVTVNATCTYLFAQYIF
jgi:hypothetical protein